MYLATRGDGSYFLAEKVNGKVKYIKNIGKDPTRYNEMKKEGKGIAAILERNPILVESLGSAVKRIYSAPFSTGVLPKVRFFLFEEFCFKSVTVPVY